MSACLKVISAFLLLAVHSYPALGKITLPSLVGDNMVLQQKSDVSLWGKARVRATVEVVPSWNNKKYTAQAAADGSWRLKVPTPTAGGPYTITLSDGEKLILNNVLIGEVWV
ncbi:MAG: sialate O-acetylesterase, partial [Pedobacter sp.]